MSKFLLCTLVCFCLMISCEPRVKTPDNKALLEGLFKDYNEFKLAINPIEATKAGYAQLNDTITDYVSTNYLAHLSKNYAMFSERIQQIDTTGLSQTRQLALRTMEWECRIKAQGLEQKLPVVTSPIYNLPTLVQFPLGQIQSLHLYVAQLAGGESVHPFSTPKDYEDWLHRLEDYIQFLDTSLSIMKQGVDSGLVLPKSLIVKMIPQVAEFGKGAAEQHLFYRPIHNLPKHFSNQEKEGLRSAFKQIIQTKIIPKYKELTLFLEEVYLPAGRDTAGIGALPGGKAVYDYLVRLHTSTDMTADEIHELGKREVQRIQGEMVRAKEALGFKGDLKAFFDHVRNNSELMPFQNPEEVIQHYKSIEARVNKSIGEMFHLMPNAGFEVRRTEAFREASASAEYVPGSKDGSRPGVFYIPIPDVKAFNLLTSESLFLHEAVPGHHFQLSLQQENKDLPKFLHPESLGVFVEGWALYSESLGKELGLYGDPLQYFGMLSMEMHRAIRLVVDTGIHAKGWTREEAIQYSLDNEADSVEGITAEIERYMGTPGQALSYKIGQLKIQELRNMAAASLGKDFDVANFHDQILNSGSLPLTLLERKIKAWVAKQKEN